MNAHTTLRAALGGVAVVLLLCVSDARAGDAPPTDAGVPEADWPEPMDTSMTFYWLQLDQLEWRLNDGPDVFRWDLQGWWGSDENKLWLKSEGEQNTTGRSGGDAEIQLLYSRMISSFFDAQLGLREDILNGPGEDRERTFAVLGFEGLAPYWFEVEPAVYVSHKGDVSFRLTSSYELNLTQRLVAQPRLEVNAAVQKVRNFGVGSGINDVELGLRLRYEVRREIAPYVGINWLRLVGDTADLARDDEEDRDVLSFVAGVRFQF